jgi:hypothetical protein
MAYTPLFDEIHASVFLALCRMANEIHDGAKLRRNDILLRLERMDGMDFSDLASRKRLESLIDPIFFSQGGEYASLFMDCKVPCRVTTYELRWLKTMLADERKRFLLEEDLHKKLMKQLEHIAPLPLEKCRVLHENGDDALSIQRLLREFQRALTTGRMVSYINRTSNGSHAAVAAPCRMEYDAMRNRYRAVLWQEESEKPNSAHIVKVSFANLEDMRCLDDRAPGNMEEKLAAFLQKKKRMCSLRLMHKTNAVERAFRLFASYDKEASYDEEHDVYALNICYYAFDKTELVEKILSLGSAVVVLKPACLRQEIIRLLSAQWKRCMDVRRKTAEGDDDTDLCGEI